MENTTDSHVAGGIELNKIFNKYLQGQAKN